MSSVVAPFDGIPHVYDLCTQQGNGQEKCAIMQEEEWEVLKVCLTWPGCMELS